MDTESLGRKHIAISTIPRLLIALLIVVAFVSIDTAQSSATKTPVPLRAFWISSKGTTVAIRNLRPGATVAVSCLSGCRGSKSERQASERR